MHASTHICAQLCMYARIHTYMCTAEHICAHLLIYARSCAYMHASTHICVQLRIYARIYTYMRAAVHICEHLRIYARSYAYMCASTHICAQLCVVRLCGRIVVRLATEMADLLRSPVGLNWCRGPCRFSSSTHLLIFQKTSPNFYRFVCRFFVVVKPFVFSEKIV